MNLILLLVFCQSSYLASSQELTISELLTQTAPSILNQVGDNTLFKYTKDTMASIPQLQFTSAILDTIFPSGESSLTNWQVIDAITSQIDANTDLLSLQITKSIYYITTALQTIAPQIQQSIYQMNMFAARRELIQEIIILQTMITRLQALGTTAKSWQLEQVPCGYKMIECNNAFAKISYALDDYLNSLSLNAAASNLNFKSELQTKGLFIFQLLYVSSNYLARANSLYLLDIDLTTVANIKTVSFHSQATNSQFIKDNFKVAAETYNNYLNRAETDIYPTFCVYTTGSGTYTVGVSTTGLQIITSPLLLKGISGTTSSTYASTIISRSNFDELYDCKFFDQSNSGGTGTCPVGSFLRQIKTWISTTQRHYCCQIPGTNFEEYQDQYTTTASNRESPIYCSKQGYYATSYTIKPYTYGISTSFDYVNQLTCSLPKFIILKQGAMYKIVPSNKVYLFLNGILYEVSATQLINQFMPNAKIVTTSQLPLSITGAPLLPSFSIRQSSSNKKYYLIFPTTGSTILKQFIPDYNTIRQFQFNIANFILNQDTYIAGLTFSFDLESSYDITRTSKRQADPPETKNILNFYYSSSIGILKTTNFDETNLFVSRGAFTKIQFCSRYTFSDSIIVLYTSNYNNIETKEQQGDTTSQYLACDTMDLSVYDCISTIKITYDSDYIYQIEAFRLGFDSKIFGNAPYYATTSTYTTTYINKCLASIKGSVLVGAPSNISSLQFVFTDQK